MKKYTSVLTLLIKSTFSKILILFALMAGLESFLFLRRMDILKHPVQHEDTYQQSFHYLITNSRILFVFLGVFLLLTVVLTLSTFETKGKISYTLRTLTITEKQFFFLQGLYHSCIYFFLFTFQIALILGMSIWYFKSVPDTNYSNQTLFLTFYVNDFMHSLLPLEDTIVAWRNILAMISIGYATAYQSYYQRRGKRPILLLALLFIGIITFLCPLGSQGGAIFMSFLSVFYLFYMFGNILRKGNGYEI